MANNKIKIIYIYIYIYNYKQFIYIYNISVSHRINIKSGGVHQWYMTFYQQCSISVIYKTVYFSINFKIKVWGSKTKGWGSKTKGWRSKTKEWRSRVNTVYIYIHIYTLQRLTTSYQLPEKVDNTFINLILSNLIGQFTIGMVEI